MSLVADYCAIDSWLFFVLSLVNDYCRVSLLVSFEFLVEKSEFLV